MPVQLTACLGEGGNLPEYFRFEDKIYCSQIFVSETRENSHLDIYLPAS